MAAKKSYLERVSERLAKEALSPTVIRRNYRTRVQALVFLFMFFPLMVVSYALELDAHFWLPVFLIVSFAFSFFISVQMVARKFGPIEGP